MTTAANRPGGKFAKKGGRHGKFSKVFRSPAGDAKATSDTPSAVGDRPKKSARRRVRVERQAKVFVDLDEAERLTMELLSLASSTASALSDAVSGEIDDEGQDDRQGLESQEARLAALLAKCDRNGEEYLQKVQKIHSLLSPHAHLVVAYENHAVDMSSKSASAADSGSAGVSAEKPTSDDAKELDSNDKKQNDKTKKRKREATSDAAASQEKEGGGERMSGKDGSTQQPPCNMYAARVEMRLAVERRDVLREMLALEKEQRKLE